MKRDILICVQFKVGYNDIRLVCESHIIHAFSISFVQTEDVVLKGAH